MIRETHYTLSEAFELIGRHLHGDLWLGGEAGVSFCRLNEDDIVMLLAGPEKAVEKAVEPSRFPGGSGEGGAPGQKMRILDHAHDEHKKPDDISMAAVLSKNWLEDEIAKEIARVEQLMVDDGSANFKPLWGPPKDEALWRLRAGDPLTEADFIILDELEKEYHAKERHESVVLWIRKRAWSGDDSEVALTGYIYTPDDGKITPIKAHCWGARSFNLLTLSDGATMDDQPWPTGGMLVFLKSELDAFLGDSKNALHTQSQFETAKLRKRLRKWIEEFAHAEEATGCVKADFLQRARKRFGSRITKNMFRESWRAAEIPANFKNAGARLKRIPE